MEDRAKRWAIVLAAGDGTRLRRLTTDRRGVTTPKQFCTLREGRTLLDDAIDRAGRLVPRGRIVTVVAERHRHWWSRSLGRLAAANTIVQPRNRGTAPGVLLPLLSILARDPEARIVVLPSDHFVEDESVLRRSALRAMSEIERRPGEVILLGITPEAAEPDYGWIVPRPNDGGPIRPVAAFVEKPGAAGAARLLRAGGAWNSFILASTGSALLGLYERRLPWLLRAFREANSAYSLAALYEGMLDADFSRDLLQGSVDSLRLLNVPACGWTDLGTPARVARALSRIPARSRRAPSRALSLARQIELPLTPAAAPA